MQAAQQLALHWPANYHHVSDYLNGDSGPHVSVLIRHGRQTGA